MKKHLLSCFFLFSATAICAQDNTGVWWGSLNIVAPYNRDVHYWPINKLNPVTGLPILPRVNSYYTDKSNPTPVLGRADGGMVSGYGLYPPVVVLDSNSVYTRAKLEIIQSGNKLVAQLTSFAVDNRQVTIYEFKGVQKANGRFVITGTSNVVNETQGEAPLFNLEGRFVDTANRYFFTGSWRSQLSGALLGNFIFEKTNEAYTINPELVHVFLNPSNKETGAEEQAKLPVYTSVYDSILTTSFSIDASMLDNGIPDNDTLSIWLNGHLIDDNVVPGKKLYFFRAALDYNEWGHLTIRCKSEGKIKGTGIFLNMNTDEKLLKYNLVLYKNDQVDWVIKRKEKTATAFKANE